MEAVAEADSATEPNEPMQFDPKLVEDIARLVDDYGALGVGQALMAAVPEQTRPHFARLLGAQAYWDTTKRLVEGSLDVAARAHGLGRNPSSGD